MGAGAGVGDGAGVGCLIAFDGMEITPLELPEGEAVGGVNGIATPGLWETPTVLFGSKGAGSDFGISTCGTL